MSDKVLIPVPGLGTLALELDAYRRALKEGERLAGTGEMATTPTDEPLVTDAELAESLGLTASWVAQAARENRIPSVRAGRYRRFRRSEVERALAANGREQ